MEKEVLERIRLLREQKKLTQSEMAVRLGTVQPNYQRIETGVTALTLDKLAQIAAVLEVPIEKLLGLGGTSPPINGKGENGSSELVDDYKDTHIKYLNGVIKHYDALLKIWEEFSKDLMTSEFTQSMPNPYFAHISGKILDTYNRLNELHKEYALKRNPKEPPLEKTLAYLDNLFMRGIIPR
jgi:transcriptional regulator with XRE-family HTH domain